MAYILQRGNLYCRISKKNAVCYTGNFDEATIFNKANKAAMKKLNGFCVVEIEGDESSTLNKSKRRTFTTSEKVEIYIKNKCRCAICGKRINYNDVTIDHIIPLAKGGTNDLSNLQSACRVCNAIKQDILPDELVDKLTEILAYQMRKQDNDEMGQD